jgi:type II secretory pathway pseudopilin PulG
MTSRTAKCARHGFAAVMAIVLIGLVAATLAAVGIMFTSEARRTRSQAADAQLRQLLIAGAAEAQQRLPAGATEFPTAAVALPPALGGDGATLSLGCTREGDTAILVTINATLDTRRRVAAQRLRYGRSGDGAAWRLERVEPIQSAP